MAKRYAIWDKQTSIITPSGEIFTADQWKVKFPVAALENITVVCSAGEINGGFFGTLGQMKKRCEDQGVDFSEASTDNDVLDIIEAWEDQINASTNEPTSEELLPLWNTRIF